MRGVIGFTEREGGREREREREAEAETERKCKRE